MDLRNCLGIMASVSTLARSSGATRAVSWVKAFIHIPLWFTTMDGSRMGLYGGRVITSESGHYIGLSLICYPLRMGQKNSLNGGLQADDGALYSLISCNLSPVLLMPLPTA